MQAIIQITMAMVVKSLIISDCYILINQQQLQQQQIYYIVNIYCMSKNSQEDNPMADQLVSQQTIIQDKIARARQTHPNHVIVYFVRHRDAPSTLPRAKTPMMMFNRDIRIEEVMYALFQQIQYKGLAFYVLKSEANDRLRYIALKVGKEGQNIGKIFEEYNRKGYLTIIYHNKHLGGRRLSPLQRNIIRFTLILGVIWTMIFLGPQITEYFNPSPSTFSYTLPDEES